ncbi:MAG: methylenetetrahydrofolate reductase [Oligoflexia bacterium]|nr:methylenetetrahydrofolate reductase [Oligoflexia bacterium]
MSILQLLKNKNNERFSFSIELIPPRRGMNLDNLLGLIEEVVPFRPLWVDVTSHSADVNYLENEDGSYKRRVWKKSPGTFGICAALKFKYGLEVVPHLLCAGFSKEETEDSLIDLNFLGITDVLALRGDKNYERAVTKDRTVNLYASDLVKQIVSMNEGKYLHSEGGAATKFSIGVACYPEKHLESPNLDYDLKHLKLKQDLGAGYAITQMFFDNSTFYNFVEKARGAGIIIPIIPGIKIISSHKQITSLPKAFNLSLPLNLTSKIDQAKASGAGTESKIESKIESKTESEVGVEWAYDQCIDLIKNGCKHIHFYVTQTAEPLVALLKRIYI